MMPRSTSAALKLSSVLLAPRALKEPVTCRFSSLSSSRPSQAGALSGAASISGVCRTRRAIRAAAASMSARVTGLAVAI